MKGLPKSLIFLPVERKIKHFLGKAERPFALTLALTYRCQSRCLTCRIWKTNKKNHKQELKIPDYLPLFENLKNDLIILNVTGGEPFLRQDLVDFIKIATGKLKRLSWLTLATNGLQTKEILLKTKRILREYRGNLSIEVSLDGEEDLHDRIRGVKGAYRKTLKTFKKLSRLAKKNPKLRVYFSHTLSRWNSGNLKNFLAVLKKEAGCDLSRLSFNLEHNGLLYQRTEDPLWEKEDRRKLKSDLDFLLKTRHLKLTPDPFHFAKSLFRGFYLRNVNKLLSQKKLIFPCQAARGSLFIDPYGNLYPCIIWDKKLDSIKNLNLKGFWENSALKKTRGEIKRGACPGCFSPCEIQYYICHNPFAIFKSLK